MIEPHTIKPSRWNVESGLVAPGAQGLWRGLRLLLPMWECGGSTMTELVDRLQFSINSDFGWEPSQRGTSLAKDSGGNGGNTQASFTQDFQNFSAFVLGGIGDDSPFASELRLELYFRWRLTLTGSAFQFVSTKGTATWSTTPVRDRIYSILGTLDDNDAKLYVDGLERDSASRTGSYSESTQDLLLRGRNAKHIWCLVAIWDRALTAAEARQLAIDPYSLISPWYESAGGVFAASGGQTISITRATEADAARTLTRLETTQIVRAGESDAARQLATQQAIALSRTGETDAARTLTPSHTVLLGRAEDSSSARALTSLETTQIGRAAETDAVRTLSALETTQIGRASESDVARTLGKSESKTLGRASESDVARTLTARKTYQLGRAGELEAARALSRLETSVLGRATEVDAARGLAVSGGGGGASHVPYLAAAQRSRQNNTVHHF